MKRLIAILFVLLLPLSGWAGKNVSKSRIAALVSEYRHCEGVEVVRLGPLATSAIRTTIRLSAKNDPDALDALRMIGGVRKLVVFDYEDCAPALKEKIARKLDRILDDSDLLMEAKDESEAVKIYGVTDEKGDTVQDLVLHTPGDCALICVFGKFSMDAIAKIAQNND